METLSTIKADTGGFVGHYAVHPPMMTYAQQRLDEVKGSLLIDGPTASCGEAADTLG
ncbi:MAG: fructose 1,6-bisphosphatase, partial [Acidimicrobiales bacterium]